MTVVYLTGGMSNGRVKGMTEKSEPFAFNAGLILELDTRTRILRRVMTYISPGERCPDVNPSILFKSASRHGGELELCTTTEIMRCNIGEWKIYDTVSLPSFNDLHHVVRTPHGTRLAVVTGLDMVAEIDAQGGVIGEWGVLGDDIWKSFSKTIDYRKVHSTKPHKSHPNFVFFIGDEPFVTRFIQRDAISLKKPERRIEIGFEGVHDGYVANNQIYFTTVDGHIVIANCDSLRIVDVINLQQIIGEERLLGWCRGFKVLKDGSFLVGFTRLRKTKHMENIAWAKRKIKKITGGLLGVADAADRPTRISKIDPVHRKLIWDVNVESYGMHAVFSIV